MKRFGGKVIVFATLTGVSLFVAGCKSTVAENPDASFPEIERWWK